MSMYQKDPGPGVFGQISWERLERLLKESGELTPRETITSFSANDRFLSFKVETVR